MVEVKAAADDAWLTVDGGQVSRYRRRYRQVLFTNTRDFVMEGEDASGQPVRLEMLKFRQHSLVREQDPARMLDAGQLVSNRVNEDRPQECLVDRLRELGIAVCEPLWLATFYPKMPMTTA